MSPQPPQPTVASATEDKKTDQNPIDDQDQYLSLEDVEKPIDEDHPQDEDEPIFKTEGLRVLAVDDSLVCLRVLVALLHHCKYSVTETTNPVEALQILRTRKHEFDIVITDLRMLEMDGFVLLQKISLEIDLPVVMLSADDSHENIMKAIRYGARDYIIKPPRLAQMKNVWQHVVRKRLSKQGCRNGNNNNSSSVTIDEETQSPPQLPVAEAKRKVAGTSRGKGDEEAASTLNGGEESGNAAIKKKRVTWTVELHDKFVDAIEQIGPNAVPMEILKIMNVPWLTRANVASHLQKFKNGLRSQSQTALPTSNVYSNSMSSAAGHSSSLPCNSQSSSHQFSMGTSSYGALPIRGISPNPNFAQIFPYQQIHQRQLLHTVPMNLSAYQAPTMLNNVPLPPRNVQSQPPLPRFHGLRFSNMGTLGNNMVHSCSFSQSLPAPAAYPSAPAASGLVVADAQQNGILADGQNYACLTTTGTENIYPQLEWADEPDLRGIPMICSDPKTGSFDVDDIFENTQKETWTMNDAYVANHAQTGQFETSTMSNTNNKGQAQPFRSTPQDKLPNVASLQPINPNLSDDDENDELTSIVFSFNYDGPPSLL